MIRISAFLIEVRPHETQERVKNAPEDTVGAIKQALKNVTLFKSTASAASDNGVMAPSVSFTNK